MSNSKTDFRFIYKYILYLSVMQTKPHSVQKIISELSCNTKSIKLGFTPLTEDKTICKYNVFDGGNDYRLFYLGNRLENIEKDRLFFPTLSHA